MGKRVLILTLQSAAILSALPALVSCSQSQDAANMKPATAEADAPEKWQSHLKPATVDKDTVIAMQETIYVPIYSHIYVENNKRTVDLAATLSVRNTDPDKSIILTAVDYYSTDGKLLKHYLNGPVTVDPLATADFVISREDSSGGSGANFLVTWISQTKVIEPLTEAIMVATGSPQSMSFTSRGVVIKKESKAEKKK